MKTSTSPLLRRANPTLEALAVRWRLAWPLLALLLLPALGTAATRTVTSLNDSGAGSLRQAIAASVNGDTINFSVAGTITLTSGELVIGRSIAINGPVAANLTVSGNNASRVFNIPPGISVNISGLTIANGHVVGPAGSDASPGTGGPGGDALGGGILNQGTLNLTNCTLSNNSAAGGRGGHGLPAGNGGAGSGGAVANQGTLNLTDCTLSNNSATGGAGGETTGSRMGMVGSNGGAGYGGGIFTQGMQTLVNCTFGGNSASGGTGGTVGAFGFTAGDGGDGYGGGIWNDQSTLAVINCTFSGNSVNGGTGGASLISGYGGTGGIAFGGGVRDSAGGGYRNTIIANDTVTGGMGGSGSSAGANGSTFGPDVSGLVTSQGHNLIGKTNSSRGWVGSDLLGTTVSPLNPQLGQLQNNGGPTFTMALLPTSAAIDAGDDAVLGPPYNLSTDQRGRARRTGDHVDIGAYEYGGITRLVTTLSDSGGGSLRDALALAMDSDRIVFTPVVTGKIRLTTGELLVNRPLTIVGPGASVLAISGNTNSRVFHIGPQGNVDIYGLTITEGRVVGTNGIDGVITWPNPPRPGGFAQGGAVFNEGSVRIFDSMIVSNSAQGGRGGNGVVGDFCCSSTGANGGPAVGAGIYSAGLMELNRCTLTGNRAVGGDGGSGGDEWFGSGATASGTGGYASGAGALARSASLESCTVAANLSTGGQGGRGAQLFAAPFYGGGGPGGLAEGGGLTGPLVLALTNCSVSGNSVTGGMGGTGSVAGAIGAAMAGGVNVLQLHVQSTIIAGNTGSASSPDVFGAVTSRGWNLIGITDGSSGWMLNDLLGNAVSPLNPLLSACQDNGGPVWTMGLLAGSPARDAGNSGLPTDARGGLRTVDFPNIPNAPGGDGSDIGALEVDSLFGAITITFDPITITKSNTSTRVRFKSDPGTTYRLQQTSVVTNRVWTNIVGAVMTGNGQNLEAIDFGPLPPTRFYRVRAD